MNGSFDDVDLTVQVPPGADRLIPPMPQRETPPVPKRETPPVPKQETPPIQRLETPRILRQEVPKPARQEFAMREAQPSAKRAMAQRTGGFERAPEQRPPKIRKIDLLWLFLALLPVVAGAVLYTNAAGSPNVWLARAEIQYRGSAWTETQDVAIQSRSLVAPVAAQFNVPVEIFEQNLQAGLVTGSQVVRVDYKSEDQELAKNVVQAMAANYIVRSSELTPEGVFETLETQRSQVESELQLAKVQQSELPSGLSSKVVADRAVIAAEIDALEKRLTIIEAKILEVSLDDLDQNANRLPIVLTEPYVLAEPVAPKPQLWGGLGLVAGGLISGVLGLGLVGFLSSRNKNWRGV